MILSCVKLTVSYCVINPVNPSPLNGDIDSQGASSLLSETSLEIPMPLHAKVCLLNNSQLSPDPIRLTVNFSHPTVILDRREILHSVIRSCAGLHLLDATPPPLVGYPPPLPRPLNQGTLFPARNVVSLSTEQ